MSNATAGSTIKTTDPITRGLLFLALINEGSGTTTKETVSGTNVTLPAGWSWGTDTTEGTYLSGNGTQGVIGWALNQSGKQFQHYTVLTVGHYNGSGNQSFFGYGTDTGSGGASTGWGIIHARNQHLLVDITGGSVTQFSRVYSSAVTDNRYLVVRRPTVAGEVYTGSSATLFDSGWSVGSNNIRQDVSASSEHFYIGSINTDTTAINGWISFAALWNRALIPSEITRILANPLVMVGQGIDQVYETGGSAGSSASTKAFAFIG